jgi:hypothetical protein
MEHLGNFYTIQFSGWAGDVGCDQLAPHKKRELIMRVLAISALFVSLSAMACPDLAGTYLTCRSTITSRVGDTDMVVAQSIINGVTVYSISAVSDESGEREVTTINADGKKYTEQFEPQEGFRVVVTSSATCEGNVLKVKINTKLNGENQGDLTMDVSKNGNQINQAIYGEVFGENVSDNVICE